MNKDSEADLLPTRLQYLPFVVAILCGMIIGCVIERDYGPPDLDNPSAVIEVPKPDGEKENE